MSQRPVHCRPLHNTVDHFTTLQTTAQQYRHQHNITDHCTTLQTTKKHYKILHNTAGSCKTLQATAHHCRPFHNTADLCKILQTGAQHCRPLIRTLHNTADHFTTLQTYITLLCSENHCRPWKPPNSYCYNFQTNFNIVRIQNILLGGSPSGRKHQCSTRPRPLTFPQQYWPPLVEVGDQGELTGFPEVHQDVLSSQEDRPCHCQYAEEVGATNDRNCQEFQFFLSSFTYITLHSTQALYHCTIKVNSSDVLI